MKTKLIVSSGITKDGLSKSNFDPCGVCCLRVKANSVLCGRWIHGKCAGVKRVSPILCSDLLYGRRFPIRLKRVVYKSYVRPAILYGSDTWCLKEGDMVIL